MAKLSLQPNPTFKVVVGIPVAGGDPALVEFTFKHRTKTALFDLHSKASTMKDIDLVMGLACGWDMDVEFNAANLTELLENYGGSGVCIYNAYVAELIKVKQGN